MGDQLTLRVRVKYHDIEIEVSAPIESVSSSYQEKTVVTIKAVITAAADEVSKIIKAGREGLNG